MGYWDWPYGEVEIRGAGCRVYDYGPLTLNTYIVFSSDLDDNCVANDRTRSLPQGKPESNTRATRSREKSRGGGQYCTVVTCKYSVRGTATPIRMSIVHCASIVSLLQSLG